MADLKGKTQGDLCIYCNRVYLYGELRNIDEIDQKFMPLELKRTICQDCSFEKFPKFYMGKSSSNVNWTKKIASKYYSILKETSRRKK